MRLCLHGPGQLITKIIEVGRARGSDTVLIERCEMTHLWMSR